MATKRIANRWLSVAGIGLLYAATLSLAAAQPEASPRIDLQAVARRVATGTEADGSAPSPTFGFGLASTMAQIRPGDVINITMVEDSDIKYEGDVSATGIINLPYLGKVLIAGRTELEAQQMLAEALQETLYEVATVSVTVVKRAAGQIYIYGAVKEPGKVELPNYGDMTILQALAEVGGVSTWAAPQDSYVLRQATAGTERTKVMVDIMRAFQDIGGESNLVLRNNDIVFIPSTTGFDSILSNEAAEVLVTGQVEKPGLVTFAPGERRTFVRAIFKAGNFSRFARKSSVRLIRYLPNGTREAKVINAERIIDEGYLDDDFEVLAGDLIIVDERKINF